MSEDSENTGYIDLGDGYSIKFVAYKNDPRAGARVRHNRSDGTPCEGFISFEGSPWAAEFEKPVVWQIQSWDPLTMSPSLLCSCGDHGFIQNGKWVRA